MVTKKTVPKAKVRVEANQWHVQLGCEVEILTRGHYPDTFVVKLPDGNTTEVDQAYLAKLH
jgi:hypothetical protein